MKVMRSVRLAAAGALVVLVAAGCDPRSRTASQTSATSQGIDGAGPRGSLGNQMRGEFPGEDGPLRDVHFDYDRFDLRNEDRAILQSNAEWLKSNPKAKVEIEGHCDERGTVEYNMALGARRADSVKSYLVALGIPAARFSTMSYGHEVPLCRDAVETCWARNRRAHSVVGP